jgi:RNA polymerase sigma-70 factor (ECF subfamily)
MPGMARRTMDARIRQTDEQEQALLDGCRRGDAGCWEQLYGLHRATAARALFRILGPCSELEDLVQTVFLRVLAGLDRFEGRSRFSTWLGAISANVAMEHLRKSKKNRVVLDEAAPERLVDPRPGPARQAVGRQELDRLQACMGRLTEKKRMVLLLHDVQQIPAEEIAWLLDIPQATVRTRLFHARRELARRMARTSGEGRG